MPARAVRAVGEESGKTYTDISLRNGLARPLFRCICFDKRYALTEIRGFSISPYAKVNCCPSQLETLYGILVLLMREEEVGVNKTRNDPDVEYILRFCTYYMPYPLDFSFLKYETVMRRER